MSTQLDEKAKRDLRRELYLDPPKFLTTILSHWFYEPLTWMHRGYLALLLRRTDFLLKYGEVDKIIQNFVAKRDPWNDSEKGTPLFFWKEDGTLGLRVARNLEIMMPRGIGKTTLGNGAHVFMGCYKERDFVLKIGETATHASTQLLNCRNEFEYNNKLISLFGQLKGDGRWAEDSFILSNGFVMEATGRGGQVRGRNVNGRRPDIIHLDDVENKESVATPEQRKKTLTWFMGDVLPALGELQTDSMIFLTGTLLHNEALLVNLGKDPTFTTVVMGVLDAQGEPVFPKYMNQEKIALKKEMYSRQGELGTFYLELFNKLVCEDTMSLRPSDIQRTLLERPLFRALCHDPAISKKRSADQAAFGVVGVYPGGRFQIELVEGFRGMEPSEAVREFFRLRDIWSRPPEGQSEKVPLLCGVEAVAYQESLISLIQEEMSRRDDFFVLEKIRYSTEKKARILGTLQPRYSAHLVHHRQAFGEYESQMAEFPSGHDDQLDVVAMCFDLLANASRAAVSIPVDSGLEESYYKDDAGESGGL